MKKQFRIHKNQEFQTILKNKTFIASPSMVLYTHPRQKEYSRVGITVSKKIGKAHVRNKIRRQIRMMCQHVLNFDEPFDLIIMVRTNYLNQTFAQNQDTFKDLIEKMKTRVSHTGEKNV